MYKFFLGWKYHSCKSYILHVWFWVCAQKQSHNQKKGETASSLQSSWSASRKGKKPGTLSTGPFCVGKCRSCIEIPKLISRLLVWAGRTVTVPTIKRKGGRYVHQPLVMAIGCSRVAQKSDKTHLDLTDFCRSGLIYLAMSWKQLVQAKRFTARKISHVKIFSNGWEKDQAFMDGSMS